MLSPTDEDYLFADKNGDVLGRTLFARFQELARGNQGNPQYIGSPFTSWVTGLLPDTTRTMVEHFFALLIRPMREQAEARVA